jgi:hypothetical protein
MAFDTRRVVAAALEAALDDITSTAQEAKDRRRLPAAPAFLLGVGTVTAARLAAGPQVRQLLGSVQERLASVQERLEDFVEEDDE